MDRIRRPYYERQKNVSVEHIPQFGSSLAFTSKKEPNIPHSLPVSKEVTSLTKVTMTTLNENDDTFSTANNAFNEAYSFDHSNETLLHRHSDRNNSCETCDGDPSRDQKTLEEDDNESVQKEHFTELEALNHHTAERASNTSTESEISRYDRSSWIFIVISWVICLVSVILMILMALEYGSQSQPEFHSITGSSDNKSDCLLCLQLILDPFNPNDPDPLLNKLTKKWEDGDLMCCAETQEQMAVLWEAVMRPWKTTTSLNAPDVSIQSSSRASAHKRLLEPERASDECKEHLYATMNPYSNDPLREHVHNVTVTNTTMIIQQTGYYFVYLSALYTPNPDLIEKDCPGQFWDVAVHKDRNGSTTDNESTLLLTISYSPSLTEMKNRIKDTGYASGVFLLEKDEYLSVCLESHNMVDFKAQSTYLGLYWMSPAKE